MHRDSRLLEWSMLPVALVLMGLLILSLLHLGRNGEVSSSLRPSLPLPPPHPAAQETRQSLGGLQRLEWRLFTNTSNPFFTIAIQPPLPPKPAEPAPATRIIPITYRGFFETSAGMRRAVVQVGEKQVLGSRGELIVADYAAMDIELRRLTLTNPAGKTVTFDFSKTQPLEVPVP